MIYLAYQALYRKYRPSSFSEVVGQEHITETLKGELVSGKSVHAYLFTGTRGTGKTTCAKILSKAVNCLSPVNGDPCGECEMCRLISDGEITDIVEIDAASNNSVDDIRQLREQVNFAPAAAKYRVYIIDEVHMLSSAAFNALLKTLEEPPAHIVFILATTEVHKLPATILSRCQRFDFRRIDPERICERIKYIAIKEGFGITDDAAMLIAAAADGGMRDALSILDLCASHSTEISEETVSSVCAMAGNEYLINLADYIKNQDAQGALLLLDELHSSSVDMLRLLSELTGHYRDLMIVKTVKSEKKPIVCSSAKLELLKAQAEKYDIRDILSALEVLQAAAGNMATGNRRCEMEMAILRLCRPKIASDTAALEMRIRALENIINAGEFKAADTKPQAQSTPEIAPPEVLPEAADEPDEIPLPEPPAEEDIPQLSPAEPKKVEAPKAGVAPVEDWEEILNVLRRSCPLIAGVLNGSRAFIKGDYLLIDTTNEQFRNLINGSNTLYRDSIRKAAQQVLGATYKLGPYKKQEINTADPLAAFSAKLESLTNN